MTDANNSHRDDRLNQSLNALRQSAPVAGPSEQLLQKTIARVGAGRMAGAGDIFQRPTKEGWWNMKLVRRTLLGTGLAAAAAIALIWLLLGTNTRFAFADVVERVKAVKMLRCKISSDVEIAGRGKITQSGDLIMSQTWMIERIGNIKMIMDNAKGQMITLTDNPKQAMVIKQENAPATLQGMNVLESFSKIDAQAGKPLPDMQIDGKLARGFEVNRGGQHMKVWADPKTELPVRIEAGIDMMPGTMIAYTDFEWDPTVTPEEISLEIPKDYPIVNVSMDASKPTEADISKMLTSWTALNDGKFPEKLSYLDMIQLMSIKMAQRQPAETRGQTPEQKQQQIQKMTSEMMTQIAPVARGIGFITDPTNGSDWTYAPTTATPNAKGQPLLWYKPAQGAAWRVFDADLTVHDTQQPPSGGTPVKKEDLSLTAPGGPQPPTIQLPPTRPGMP